MNHRSVCLPAKYVASSSSNNAGHRALFLSRCNRAHDKSTVGCDGVSANHGTKEPALLRMEHCSNRAVKILNLPVPFHMPAQKHCAQRLIVKLSVPRCMDILAQVERLLIFPAAAFVVVAVVAEHLRECTK